MKSSKLLSILALSSLLVLGACGKKEESKATSSSSKTTQMSSNKKATTKKSSTDKSSKDETEAAGSQMKDESSPQGQVASQESSAAQDQAASQESKANSDQKAPMSQEESNYLAAVNGTWANGYGTVLDLADSVNQRNIKYEGPSSSTPNAYVGREFNGTTSAGLLLVPAGVPFSYVDSNGNKIEVESDTSRDRLVVLQSVPDAPAAFFYKQ